MKRIFNSENSVTEQKPVLAINTDENTETTKKQKKSSPILPESYITMLSQGIANAANNQNISNSNIPGLNPVDNKQASQSKILSSEYIAKLSQALTKTSANNVNTDTHSNMQANTPFDISPQPEKNNSDKSFSYSDAIPTSITFVYGVPKNSKYENHTFTFCEDEFCFINQYNFPKAVKQRVISLNEVISSGFSHASPFEVYTTKGITYLRMPIDFYKIYQDQFNKKEHKYGDRIIKNIDVKYERPLSYLTLKRKLEDLQFQTSPKVSSKRYESVFQDANEPAVTPIPTLLPNIIETENNSNNPTTNFTEITENNYSTHGFFTHQGLSQNFDNLPPEERDFMQTWFSRRLPD